MPEFQPGDCLLYGPSGMFGWLIVAKTWHQIAHVEVYIGDGYSVAARDGVGVGAYPVRTKQLTCVLRPNQPFNLTKALGWFILVAKGQKYDWWGLLRFAWRSRVVDQQTDNKMFCSEFAARFYREGGLDLFNNEDADAIAPFQFELSPYLTKMKLPR